MASFRTIPTDLLPSVFSYLSFHEFAQLSLASPLLNKAGKKFSQMLLASLRKPPLKMDTALLPHDTARVVKVWEMVALYQADEKLIVLYHLGKQQTIWSQRYPAECQLSLAWSHARKFAIAHDKAVDLVTFSEQEASLTHWQTFKLPCAVLAYQNNTLFLNLKGNHFTYDIPSKMPGGSPIPYPPLARTFFDIKIRWDTKGLYLSIGGLVVAHYKLPLSELEMQYHIQSADIDPVDRNIRIFNNNKIHRLTLVTSKKHRGR